MSLYEELSTCSVGETQVKYPKLLKVPEQLSIRGGRTEYSATGDQIKLY